MALLKHTYLSWISQKDPNFDRTTYQGISIVKRSIYDDIPNQRTLTTDFWAYYPTFDPQVGDIVDITFDFTIPKSFWSTNDDGDTGYTENFFSDVFRWSNLGGSDSKVIYIGRGILSEEDVMDALADPSKAIRMQGPLELNTQDSDLYVIRNGISITIIESPSKVVIDGKVVKTISFGGKELDELTIGGSKYTFSKDISVTQADVEKLVLDNTTWGLEKFSGIEIKSEDYTKVLNTINTLYFVDLDVVGWPTIRHEVPPVEGIKITFNNDISVQNYGGLEIVKRIENTGYIFKMSINHNFKSGETWLFKEGEGAVKYIPPEISATIDTTVKLNGLDVTYSESTGIADGEKITATVKYDSSVSPTLNGGTVDVVYSDIDIVSPDRTITKDEVEAYIKANTVFTGTNGHLDVTAWPYAGTTLFTATASITKGDDIVYTVRANSGFTINGGATVDYTINIPDKIDVVYVGELHSLKKIVDDSLIDLHIENIVFMTQIQNGTIYMVSNADGILKLENDKIININGWDRYTSTSFIHQVADGTVYVGHPTARSGLFKVEGDQLTLIDNSVDLSSSSMVQADDGTIYTSSGNYSNGIYKLDVAAGKLNQIISGPNSVKMYKTSDGKIYYIDSGLYEIVNDSAVKVGTSDVPVKWMCESSNGTIYVITSSSVMKLENGEFVMLDDSVKSLSFIYSLSDGNIYVGSSSGIKKLVNDKLIDYIDGNFPFGFMTEVQI